MSTPPAGPNEPTDLARALGRIPSGLYILTARDGPGRSTGMLASWVMQAGFEPPMLTVAVHRDRYVGSWIDATRRFALNQVPTGNKALIRHFGRGFPEDAPAFDGPTLRDDLDAGGPILADALAYLDCELAGQLDGEGDHRILLARVVAGGLLASDAEPLIHVRKNGLHY